MENHERTHIFITDSASFFFNCGVKSSDGTYKHKNMLAIVSHLAWGILPEFLLVKF